MAPPGSLSGQLHPEHLRHEHRDGLAEHARLGLDPADAPAHHAQPVDHRRMRVGADQRVRIRHRLAVARVLEHDAGEVLEVDLVDDAGVGRDDAEVGEGVLPPAQEDIALAVPRELEIRVELEGVRPAVGIDLDGVVDDELDGLQRVDARRIAAEANHRVAHRRKVHDARHAGEVLEQDSRGRECDLLAHAGGRVPVCERRDVGGAHERPVLVPQQVLEEDLQRERQLRHARVTSALQSREAEDVRRRAVDDDVGGGRERVDGGHVPLL